MQMLYTKVNEVLSKVNFNAIWPGFSQSGFALYNDDEVYLANEVIAYDNRFLGNTSIEYNDEFIAIWYVKDPEHEDIEILASNLVHEMFHVFQKLNDECRYPNDLILLSYPDNIENYIVKYQENLLLAKAYRSDDITLRKELLEQYMAARKYRERLIGDIINQEYLTETIEGMAEYAGCMALKQISYEKYICKINDYIEILQSFNEYFFEIRRMLYYSGVVSCIVLNDIHKNFYHKIGDTELSLFSIILRDVTEEKPIINIDMAKIFDVIDKYLINKNKTFDDFILTHSDTISCKGYICGYDPMNMSRLDDMLLCTKFVMIKSDVENSPIFIQGPVLINLVSGTIREVISYIK